MKTNLAGGMTLGSDPELMLFSKEQGRIVSSIPVLKRNKHDPIDLGDGAKMYADNVLVEASFNPSTTKEGFITTFRSVFGKMQEKLGPKFSLMPKAAHLFDEDQLQDKSAKESGCNDNFDVYARKKGPPPPFTDGLRTGSFHIHIGHDELLAPPSKDKMVKLLDIFLGCASIIFDGDESSPKRRKLYGKAGEFRPTSYGVEYRVLGNFALRSPKTTELVVDLVDWSMKHMLSGQADDIIDRIGPSSVQMAINENMKGLAKAILLNAGVTPALMGRINKTYKPSLYSAWGLE